MNYEVIISSCITLIGTIISYISCTKLLSFRISQLEKRMDKHNNVIERTYKLEQKIIDLERSVYNG